MTSYVFTIFCLFWSTSHYLEDFFFKIATSVTNEMKRPSWKYFFCVKKNVTTFQILGFETFRIAPNPAETSQFHLDGRCFIKQTADSSVWIIQNIKQLFSVSELLVCLEDEGEEK